MKFLLKLFLKSIKGKGKISIRNTKLMFAEVIELAECIKKEYEGRVLTVDILKKEHPEIKVFDDKVIESILSLIQNKDQVEAKGWMFLKEKAEAIRLSQKEDDNTKTYKYRIGMILYTLVCFNQDISEEALLHEVFQDI